MKKVQIAPKDWVIYVDQDGIEWGPWQVIRVVGEHLVLQINEFMQHTFSKDKLRKV